MLAQILKQERTNIDCKSSLIDVMQFVNKINVGCSIPIIMQAKRVQFEFHKGAINHAYMRIDGEPWKQPLSVEDDKVAIEISHSSRVNMLANLPCRAKSVHDPSSTHSHGSKHYVNENDEFAEEYEVVRKFGAASTFKYVDAADTAHYQ